MTREQFLNQIGDFTYMWGNEFHIQIGDKAYLWLDPEYPGGDNTITPYQYTQIEMGEMHANDSLPWGRDKGTHVISSYTGNDVVLNFDLNSL